MPDYGVVNDRSPHIIADLCELVCYLEDISVSRGDIESFIQQRGGEGLLQELEANNDSETNDRIQRLTEDAFQNLLFRSTAFGDWYPFLVDHDVIELKEQFREEHKVYAALLADSRLKMFPRAVRTRLASEFEVICAFALPALLPSFTIYHFGVGGSQRELFGNKLKDALPALADKMRDYVIQPHIDELSDQNCGDAGIDLVALYEWQDAAQAVPAYFCQCAAQQEGWPEKRFESHSIAHERYFSFFHKPGSILFIPVCYRQTNGAWIDAAGHQTLLIDRLRLVELFNKVITRNVGTLHDLVQMIGVPLMPGDYQVIDDQEAA